MATIEETLGSAKYNELCTYFKDNYADLFEKKKISVAIAEKAKEYGIGKTSISTQIIPLKEKFNLRRVPKPGGTPSKGKNVDYTEEQQKQIKNLWDSQPWKTKNEFYEFLKSSSSMPVACKATVYRVLEKQGADVQKYGNPTTLYQKEVVSVLWAEKYSIDEMMADSRLSNLSKQTIESYIRSLGYTFSRTELFKKEVLDYYYEFGTEKTEEVYKIPQSTQARWREEFNFPSRDNSLSYRKYPLDESIFENIDTEIKAATLGLIATDGNVFKNVISIELANDNDNINLLTRIKKELFKTTIPLYPTLHYDKREDRFTIGIKLQITSTKITKDLEKYKIVPNKSKILNMNLEIISRELLRHFWRGCICGDGSLFLRGGQYETIDYYGTEDMCNKFNRYIFEELNINGNIYEHHGIKRLCWQITSNAINVSKFLYENSQIYLERKKNIALNWVIK